MNPAKGLGESPMQMRPTPPRNSESKIVGMRPHLSIRMPTTGMMIIENTPITIIGMEPLRVAVSEVRLY
ncbi:MAG: hypothetical protein BWY71_02111 [Planctomycetes bacterium ADurb.Bin412]|nr:MAG: hypothetical protein BWY71_02111 [Planctomycetes bacterium ADurb.Bin412]